MIKKTKLIIDNNPLSIYLQSISNKFNSQNGGNSCSTDSNKSGIFQKQPRIIAVGDIHGDLEALFVALLKANVIDLKGKWTGKDTYVVQLGDILDKGGRGQDEDESRESVNEELVIIHFLNDLDEQAKKEGGRVLCILGNHELMNVLSQNFDYVTKKGMQMSYKNKNRHELLKPGGLLSKQLACQAYAIIKIGDWIFVHAGLLSNHLRQYNEGFFEKMNNLVKKILTTGDLTDDDKQLLQGRESIFWTRSFTNNPNACKDVNETFNILKLNNGGIVVGHTVQNTINSKCNDRVWFVDTGMSEAFGKRNQNDYSKIQVLEIINNNNGETNTKNDYGVKNCGKEDNDISCKKKACKDNENCSVFVIS